MKRARVGALVTALVLGACERHEPASADVRAPVPVTRASASTERDAAHAIVDASVAPSAPTASAPVGAGAVFEGGAEGRGVEAPIHEFAPHAVTDPWSGSGTARLEVPAHDGAVTGTITLGALVFRASGVRAGDHVRATLTQVAPPGAEPSEDLFRGMLDADVTGTAVRGTWEASAGAGVRRRHGTIDARRH